MNIAIVGAGYVGLTTAASIPSEKDKRLILVESAAEKLDMLKTGVEYISEPGVFQTLKEKSKQVLLLPYIAPGYAIDAFFICVGTPLTASGSVCLDNVESTIAGIKPKYPDALIVIRSTVPPGTTETLTKQYGSPIAVMPEFFQEGQALEDALHPQRVIIGCNNNDIGSCIQRIFGYEDKITHICDPTTAELVKYASNAFLATKISYANLISNLCSSLNVDNIGRVLELVGKDKRIGEEFLKFGLGFGGSCLRKDLVGLIKVMERYDIPADLFISVLDINKRQIRNVIRKVRRELGGRLKGKTIAVLGLSFKSGVSDVRESQAIALIHDLLQEGVNIKTYDPLVTDIRDMIRCKHCDSTDEAIDRVDCVVIAVACPEFAKHKYPKNTPIIDPWCVLTGRNKQ